jgi:Ala-tRNA(Pro) deacylase
MNEEIVLRTCHFLDTHGISYECLSHAAAYTMEECAAVESQLGAPICKNLFLCNRQQTQFYLLMLPADKVFKTKYLSSQLGCARLSFADESHMVDLLDIHPGAVSPMGLMNDTTHSVLLVIDRDLLSQTYIGCHPCVNTASLRIALHDLLDKFVPATEHEYRIVDLIEA